MPVSSIIGQVTVTVRYNNTLQENAYVRLEEKPVDGAWSKNGSSGYTNTNGVVSLLWPSISTPTIELGGASTTDSYSYRVMATYNGYTAYTEETTTAPTTVSLNITGSTIGSGTTPSTGQSTTETYNYHITVSDTLGNPVSGAFVQVTADGAIGYYINSATNGLGVLDVEARQRPVEGIIPVYTITITKTGFSTYTAAFNQGRSFGTNNRSYTLTADANALMITNVNFATYSDKITGPVYWSFNGETRTLNGADISITTGKNDATYISTAQTNVAGNFTMLLLSGTSNSTHTITIKHPAFETPDDDTWEKEIVVDGVVNPSRVRAVTNGPTIENSQLTKSLNPLTQTLMTVKMMPNGGYEELDSGIVRYMNDRYQQGTEHITSLLNDSISYVDASWTVDASPTGQYHSTVDEAQLFMNGIYYCGSEYNEAGDELDLNGCIENGYEFLLDSDLPVTTVNGGYPILHSHKMCLYNPSVWAEQYNYLSNKVYFPIFYKFTIVNNSSDSISFDCQLDSPGTMNFVPIWPWGALYVDWSGFDFSTIYNGWESISSGEELDVYIPLFRLTSNTSYNYLGFATYSQATSYLKHADLHVLCDNGLNFDRTSSTLKYEKDIHIDGDMNNLYDYTNTWAGWNGENIVCCTGGDAIVRDYGRIVVGNATYTYQYNVSMVTPTRADIYICSSQSLSSTVMSATNVTSLTYTTTATTTGTKTYYAYVTATSYVASGWRTMSCAANNLTSTTVSLSAFITPQLNVSSWSITNNKSNAVGCYASLNLMGNTSNWVYLYGDGGSGTDYYIYGNGDMTGKTNFTITGNSIATYSIDNNEFYYELKLECSQDCALTVQTYVSDTWTIFTSDNMTTYAITRVSGSADLSAAVQAANYNDYRVRIRGAALKTALMNGSNVIISVVLR